MKITDLPRHERPREKLLERGPDGLKDRELLAILLRTGGDGKNAIELADYMLRKYPLRELMSFTARDFISEKGVDAGKACSLLAAFALTKRALAVEDRELPVIDDSRAAVAQLQELRTARKEHFAVLYLNARNQLIRKETISIGTLNASLVHPREVYKPAIEHLAAAIVVAHNHPSGGLEPSASDLELTRRLAEAGRLLGIELIDHLIITAAGHQSII